MMVVETLLNVGKLYIICEYAIHLIIDMSVNYRKPEDLLSDESFLSWYFKTGDEDNKKWEHWMSENPDHIRLVQEAVALLQHVRQPEKAVPANQVKAAESALFEKISGLERSGNGQDMIVPALPLFRDRRWMVAAAVVLVLVVGLAVVKVRSGVTRQEMKTEFGQLSSRQLPDGTEVMMNANSRIGYTDDWKDGADREVWMSGQVFFHVTRTAMRSRFIVHLEHFDIIVTGTQFDVVNRHGIENVLLEEGSVLLQTHNGKKLDMKPGDFVAFRDAQLQKKPVQSDSLIAWKEQKLIFDRTPLRDVTTIISDQYGVHVALENKSIGDSTISGMLANNNLEVLLNALKATSDFDVIKTGDSILIKAHSGPN
jgi:transmembrane sensor